jgi:hypothetical protein
MLDIDGEIACAMHDQCGDSDSRKHMSHIDAVAHTQEGLSSPEARARPFQSPNKSAKLLVARQAWADLSTDLPCPQFSSLAFKPAASSSSVLPKG